MKDPNAMDVDSVRLPKLTPEEQEKYAKKGLCFHCRKSGHMVSACPGTIQEPFKKPHVQCACKEEKLPELKEIEDEEEDKGVAWVSSRLNKDF